MQLNTIAGRTYNDWSQYPVVSGAVEVKFNCLQKPENCSLTEETSYQLLDSFSFYFSRLHTESCITSYL